MVFGRLTSNHFVDNKYFFSKGITDTDHGEYRLLVISTPAWCLMKKVLKKYY